jgi:uncharacterized protein YerC
MTDLKKLANAILHANDEAEMYRLLSPLTAEETEDIAQLVEMVRPGLPFNANPPPPC